MWWFVENGRVRLRALIATRWVSDDPPASVGVTRFATFSATKDVSCVARVSCGEDSVRSGRI